MRRGGCSVLLLVFLAGCERESPTGGAPDSPKLPSAPVSRSEEGRSAAPAVVATERGGFAGSRYGQFESQLDNQECIVAFRHRSGKVSQVFKVSDCIGDSLGVDRVGPVDRVGSLALPALAGNGDELHLFAIAAARGGNGVTGYEYWAVVVRDAGVWATEKAFDGELNQAAPLAGEPGWVLEQSSTTTVPGEKHTIRFGKAEKVGLPLVPSKIVSKTTKVFVGDLSGGYHATNWRPILTASKTETIVDEDGPCKLPELGAEGGHVRMSAEVTTWSDGRTHVKCLSIVQK